MSKFSGFNSRQQESTYNKFVYKTLEIFADEIITKRKFQFLYGKYKIIARNRAKM